MRRGGRGGRNRWCPGPASGPLIRIGSVRISSDRCKHTSETACFLARFARLGGRGGPGGVGEEQTVGEEGEGTRKVGVPAAPGAPPPPISGRTGGQGLTRGPRVGGGGRRLAWREGGRSRRTDSDARGGRAAQRSAPAGVPEPLLPSLYNRPPPHGSSPGQGGWAGALGCGPALEGPRRRGRALPGFASRNPAPA